MQKKQAWKWHRQRPRVFTTADKIVGHPDNFAPRVKSGQFSTNTLKRTIRHLDNLSYNLWWEVDKPESTLARLTLLNFFLHGWYPTVFPLFPMLTLLAILSKMLTMFTLLALWLRSCLKTIWNDRRLKLNNWKCWQTGHGISKRYAIVFKTRVVFKLKYDYFSSSPFNSIPGNIGTKWISCLSNKYLSYNDQFDIFPSVSFLVFFFT